MDISWKKLNRKFDANVEALSTIEPREKITSLIEKIKWKRISSSYC